MASLLRASCPALALVIAVVVVVAPLTAQGTPPPLKVGGLAPVVTVKDLNGKEVRIAAVPGKKGAVVEFWATWCEICAKLMPRMEEAKSRFGDRFEFFGVNVTVSDAKARVQRYVDLHKPPFITLYDETGSAVRAFQAPATSYLVIVDAAGVVRYIGSGADQNVAAELGRIVKP